MFRIHQDAKRWGANLLSKEGPLKTQFDIYYLSFLVGIGLGRSQDMAEAEVTEITRTVTEPYTPYRYVLAGLLLVSELTNSGLPLSKPLVKAKVAELLDSHSQTFLSDAAVELMNGYAYGGFEAIREHMPKAPAAHDFLIWYYNAMIPECFKDELWKG